ncbi:MAG: hypothetical protein WD623_04725 [Marinobacter sp.]|uniref:hypothetical protein n=1 Tax=Marinobacter sp. TaxID=50741 RepID=UPI0034A02937
MTEDQLEQQCLEWFAEGRGEVAHGPNLAPDGESPEPADYRQVLLLAARLSHTATQGIPKMVGAD